MQRSSCNPATLTRAARDFADKRREFALDAGIAALRWIREGEGYDIDTTDVHEACEHTMKAGANAGRQDVMREPVRDLIARSRQGDRYALSSLRQRQGLG